MKSGKHCLPLWGRMVSCAPVGNRRKATRKSIRLAAVLMISCTFLIRGELAPLVQHIPAGPAIAALFRSVPMPGGAVPALRPPAETRPALTNLIAGAPRDAMLYRLRAQQDEMALDFAAAEADWKNYAQHAPDPYTARTELADFYHRRNRPVTSWRR